MKEPVYVRRRSQSGQSQDDAQALKSATPVLQSLFSQLASLKQKVNENALAGAEQNKPQQSSKTRGSGKSRQSDRTHQEKSDKNSRQVRPSRLRKLFD